MLQLITEDEIEDILTDIIYDQGCYACRGSGEGQFDGTTCLKCKGSGMIKISRQQAIEVMEETVAKACPFCRTDTSICNYCNGSGFVRIGV